MSLACPGTWALAAVMTQAPSPAPAQRGYAGPQAVPVDPDMPSWQPRAETPSPPPKPAPEPDSEPDPGPVRPPPRRRPSVRIPPIGPVQPWIRYTLFAEYYGQNYDEFQSNDGFIALVNRLNVGEDTRLRRVTIGAQVRVDTQNAFFLEDRPCGGPGEEVCNPIDNDYRLERTTLRIQSSKVSATLGDFNANFGRGIPLSVRKVDEIGVDATIKGGRFDLRTRPLRWTVLGGFANRQNSDFATRQILPDPGYPASSYFGNSVDDGACDVDGAIDPEIGNPVWTYCSDLILGTRLDGTLPGKVNVGAHYAFIDFGEESQAIVRDVDESIHVVGGDVGRARIAGVWDLYAGASGLLRNPHLRDDGLPQAVEDELIYQGYAVYLANTFVKDSTTVLVEAKHYDQWMLALRRADLLQYSEAPTLEREDQQVPAANNATGGRIRVDHTWRDKGVTLFFSTLEYAFSENVRRSQEAMDQGLPGSLDPEEVAIASHNYAGVIWRKPGSDFAMQVGGGYRIEKFLTDDHMNIVRRKFPHGELYFSIPLAREHGLTHSLTVRGEGRWEEYQELDRFFRGFLLLGYSLNPYFSLSFVGGIDTEFPTPDGEPSLTDESCAGTTASRCRPHLWPGAELKVQILDASFIRIFAGRQMGGRICVNGSCRLVPDFEGVRTELTFSF